jgi:DNA-binding Xre family transcriptional regulator
MAKAKLIDTHEFPSLDSYLEERGLLEQVSIAAEKLAISRQLVAEMQSRKISKSEMAERMGTSRAQLDRVLNPSAQNVTIETLARAARVLGKRLHMELV